MERAVVLVHKLTDAEVERLCCRKDLIKLEAAAEGDLLLKDDEPSSGSPLEDMYIKSEVPDAELETVTVKDEPIDWHQEPQASSSSGPHAVTFKREVDNDCTKARSGHAEAKDELREGSSCACNTSAVNQGPVGASQWSTELPQSYVWGSGSGVEAAPCSKLMSRPLLCEHCDYSTGKKDCIRQHLRVRHKLGSYNECELCDVTRFSSEAPKKSALDNSKVYKCEVCEYSSARAANLKPYLSGKRKTGCQISKSGEDQLYMRRFNDHSPVRNTDNEVQQASKDGKGQLFRCELCDYSSVYKRGIKLHRAGKHGKGRLFKCELCDYTSAFKYNIKRHLVGKHGKGQLFKCEFCDHSAACKNRIEEHQASQHGKGQLFKCKLCEYSSPRKYTIRSHLVSKHGKGQLFNCEICDYSSAWKTSVRIHLASKHGKGQLFKCELCDYTSVYKTGIKLHRAGKHGKGRLFKCEFCDYSSAWKKSIREHLASRHGKGQVFKCELCDYTSARKRSVKQHRVCKHDCTNMLPFQQ